MIVSKSDLKFPMIVSLTPPFLDKKKKIRRLSLSVSVSPCLCLSVCLSVCISLCVSLSLSLQITIPFYRLINSLLKKNEILHHVELADEKNKRGSKTEISIIKKM